MVLREGHIIPIDRTFIDKYISSVPRSLPHTKVKRNANKKYISRTIFVHHEYSYVHIQKKFGITVGKTLFSKKISEQHTTQFDVKFKGCLTEYVTFESSEFIWNIKDNNMNLFLSGTGACHHNEVSEWLIQTITNWVCAMYLNSIIMWTTTANVVLYYLFQQPTIPSGDIFIYQIINLWTSTSPPYLRFYSLSIQYKAPNWKYITQVESTLMPWSISGSFIHSFIDAWLHP